MSGLDERAPRIGLDLGGTKIEVVVAKLDRDAGAVDEILRERRPTAQEEGYEAIVARAAGLVREACARTGLDLTSVPVGVGMPGGIERRTGCVKNSNTTCLNGRAFRADLMRELGRPVAFENDANCFALAETALGAAREHRAGLVFGVIMGTGVGGGLVFRCAIWSGLHGIGGEWGHHAVFARAPDARACYCGKTGCLEAYASGPAVEAHYARLAGLASSATLRVSDIAAARTAGDPHAEQAIDVLLDAFGRGLANVIDICDPSAIVLGGGLSKLDLLYSEGRERVARYVFNDELLTPIVRPTLGDSAGVLGAALLAR